MNLHAKQAIHRAILYVVIDHDSHHATVEELVWRNTRARFMAETYLKRLGERRNEIVAAGEKVKLVTAGNHCQGCIFRDGWHLHTPALANRIDRISKQLAGFNIALNYGNSFSQKFGF